AGGGGASLVRVSVRYGSGGAAGEGAHEEGSFAVRDFSAELRPGTVTVLAGPSGAGKSSILGAMLGFVPYTGTVRSAPIAWAGQRPGLLAGTVFENVTLGSEHPSAPLAARALALAALPAAEVDPALVLGVNGAGLSGGQAQRVAVARAIYRLLERDCGVLLLDEPSSALDAEAEARLIAGIRSLADDGAAVLVVSHRAVFRSAADRALELAAPAAGDGADDADAADAADVDAADVNAADVNAADVNAAFVDASAVPGADPDAHGANGFASAGAVRR
ncbi:hypothetical protein C5B96_16885, partial [Subtercola sp. Z020]|uniref:ATP-binding cassette domain-containing protein n=1 Tax=Subtercola sp. Z020 TaxID=2080582 RepID=UPI000D4A71F2